MKTKLLFLLIGILLIGFAFAGTTPPVTTFSSFQVPNTSDQNITLTCTDNNTGCKTIWYNINNTTWQSYNFFANKVFQVTDQASPTLGGTFDLNNTQRLQSTITGTLSMNFGVGSATSSAYLVINYSDGTSYTTPTQIIRKDTNNGATVTFTGWDTTKLDKNIQAFLSETSLIGSTVVTLDLNIKYGNGNYPYSTNFLYSSAGFHSIQYFSTDNSDNNETMKDGNWTTYGTGHFTFRDQNSGALLTGVTVNDGTNTTTTAGSTYDTNFASLSGTTQITYTFTKANYATRYYSADLNQYSDFNVTFALLPDSIDADVPFKVYQTDDTTIYANTYVEVKDSDTNYTVGRLKTNSAGEATFNLKADDSNYLTIVDNGAFTYTPVTLTILYPKNESTLAQITELWKVEITQNLYAQYTNLNTSKVIYLLPNTSLPYNIRISDMNGNYFPRSYAKIYPGNPTTDTLQPYLVLTTSTNAILTTIRTVSAYDNQPVGDITIKIYKYIASLGRTYIEQVVTDEKGEALTYAITGEQYEYEIYSGTTLIQTDKITASSAVVYLRIDNKTITQPTYGQINATVTYLPNKQVLSQFDYNLIQTIKINNYDSNVTITSIHITVTNNFVNGNPNTTQTLYDLSIPYTNQTTITNNIDINAIAKDLNGIPYDTNGMIIITVTIVTTDQNYTSTIVYKPFTTFDPVYSIGLGSRDLFACNINDPLIPCPGQLIIALIISFVIVAGLSYELGFSNPSGLGIMFLLILGVFTYFTWVPIILYGLLCAGSFVVLMAARGRFT